MCFKITVVTYSTHVISATNFGKGESVIVPGIQANVIPRLKSLVNV